MESAFAFRTRLHKLHKEAEDICGVDVVSDDEIMSLALSAVWQEAREEALNDALKLLPTLALPPGVTAAETAFLEMHDRYVAAIAMLKIAAKYVDTSENSA